MQKTTSNTAAPKTAKTSTPNPMQYEAGHADVPGMDVITGYYTDSWCRAIGFVKGRLSLFECRLERNKLTPITLRQGVKECGDLIVLGTSAALDFASLDEHAQAKFYGMVAAALR